MTDATRNLLAYAEMPDAIENQIASGEMADGPNPFDQGARAALAAWEAQAGATQP